jgi:hypothetical protein
MSVINKIKTPAFRLAGSNFLFVSAYTLLGPHALFLHNYPASEQSWIYLGMSFFGASQIGGIWLLSLLNSGAEKSISLMMALRIASLLLLYVPYAPVISLSLLFFGLSHAIYYKVSRQYLSELIRNNDENSRNGYLLLSLSTNLSYILITSLGSWLILKNIGLVAGIPISILTLILAYFTFGRRYIPALPTDAPLSNIPSADLSPEMLKSHPVVKDALRFLGFILPYTYILALIPIKVRDAGLSSSFNSTLIATNSIIVVTFQIVSVKLKTLTTFSQKTYDTISIIATTLMVLSSFLDVGIFTVLLILWSFCEAYQLPNIEHMLFSERKYQEKTINRFLFIDAVGCFLGPILAGYTSSSLSIKQTEIGKNILLLFSQIGS